MKKITKTLSHLSLVLLLSFLSCKKNDSKPADTILEGKATLYVDETVLPIIEDEQAFFETEYKAKLQLVAKPEKEIVNALLKDSVKIAVLARPLSASELKAFQAKKVNPKTTPFATDAIALIRSKSSQDTLVSLQSIVNCVKGVTTPSIQGLVFDNANSSSVRELSQISGVAIGNQKNVFSLNNNEAVIKYVAEHPNMIGVIGMNWILQPPLDLQEHVDKLTVLSVKGLKGDAYYDPSQDNLAMNLYPLARQLYLVNCQGYSGLGMGFASFLAGERGQRIILKSGLVPVRFPSRKILIRNKITKDKN